MKLIASNLALKQRLVITAFIRALLLLIVNSCTHKQIHILFPNKDLAPYRWTLQQPKKIYIMIQIVKIRCLKEIENIRYLIAFIVLSGNKILAKRKWKWIKHTSNNPQKSL